MRSVRFAVGGSAYSPSNPGSLVTWIDILDPSAFSESSGTFLSVTNKVTSTVYNTGTLPTYSTIGLNSKPSMVFNGSTQYIETTESSVINTFSGEDPPYTVFYVASYDDPDSLGSVVWAGVSGSNNNYAVFGQIDTLGGNHFHTRRPGSVSTPISTASGTVDTNPHIYEWVYNGSLISFLIGGVITSINDTPLNTAAIATADTLTFGRRSITTPDLYLNASVGEILIYSSALDSVQRRSVREYLGSKWNLSVS